MTTAKRDNPVYRQRVYKIVRRIPAGHVMTYGQIAEILGEGYTPRTIGFVMHGSDDATPWHRVVNAQGGCSQPDVLWSLTTSNSGCWKRKESSLVRVESVTFKRISGSREK